MVKAIKPLGIKAYGKIPHLPGSKFSKDDVGLPVGEARFLLEKKKDKDDIIYVTEKLDGSNVAIAKINGRLQTLQRAGYPCMSSPYKMHHMFHRWVMQREDKFLSMLNEGERLNGEWLAQAHGTRYEIVDDLFDPFAVFDIMIGFDRIPLDETLSRCLNHDVNVAPFLHRGGPIPIENILSKLGDRGFLS